MLKLNSFRTIKLTGGFTLIELLVAIVIIGVLAVFAFPNYQNYVHRTRRADAEQALMVARQSMERGYSSSYSYITAAATVFPITNPPNGYTIAIAATPAITASTFHINAAPIAGGPQANDPCGILGLDQSGTKFVSTSTVAACW